MKNQIEKYVKKELSNLKYKGDSIELKNVYPSLLEDIIGNFTPYEFNGYDCDYWAKTDKYDVFGCMRFGTAEITLRVGREKPKEEIVEVKNEEPQKPVILRMKDVSEDILSKLQMFYFTFGNGQMNSGYYQPIMAKNDSVAHKKMFELYGTAWAFMYDEKDWIIASKHYIDKDLEVIVALESDSKI